MSEELKIKIDIQQLKDKSVFIATPMYGGQCSGYYMKSVLDLTVLFNKYGIKNNFFALLSESLISRARNYCAAEFMRSGYTHLLFLDSDLEFKPMDALGALQISVDNPDTIICAPYPKKSISWEKVKQAVDNGFADENPFVLDNYTGDFVFSPIKSGENPINFPMEVKESGTGFMLIDRKILEKWDVERPEYRYKPDHIRSKGFDGSEEITAYFQDPLRDKRHLSEDYFFCEESRKMGSKVLLCPWMNLNHIGTYKFVGNLAAVAATGKSITADMEEVKGLKK